MRSWSPVSCPGLEDHARLYARGIRVIGNVQAEGAARVNVVSSSRVGGSVQAKQGGAAKVLDSRIVGDIQYDDNRRLLKANRNRVGARSKSSRTPAAFGSTAT